MKSTDVRVTPIGLFNALDDEFHFSLDAAANTDNARVPNWLGPDHPDRRRHDALSVSWREYAHDEYCGFSLPVWLNPPFSDIQTWLHKVEEEVAHGLTVVCLLPADTSTKYFHKFARRYERRYLTSRVKFGGAPLDAKGRQASAKQPTMIVVASPAAHSPLWAIER